MKIEGYLFLVLAVIIAPCTLVYALYSGTRLASPA
jgi:hypothetical protein